MSETGSEVRRLYPDIHALEPLLDHEEFILAETEVGGSKERMDTVRGPLRKAIIQGVVKRVERVPTDGNNGGNYCYRYRWVADARERLQAYLDSLEKLPCGCRTHIPDSRDDPEGIITCKHCDEPYHESTFKELVT